MRKSALAAIACAIAVQAAAAPLAAAIPPSVVDPNAPAPDDGAPGPVVPMKQRDGCSQSVVIAGSDFRTVPAGEVFPFERLHKIATGAGVTVAVIDSGVAPNIRLPNLRGGGDYIMGGGANDSKGLDDCSHHGTLVAGIIAARPRADDGFSGVAPDSEIVSIRQSSGAFAPDNPPPGYDAARAAQDSLTTLARAIVHAANLGARVVNISVVACAPADHPPEVDELAGALYYAAVAKDVVVVASAGNIGGAGCRNNPEYNPAHPEDPRNWGDVASVSYPSYFAPLVLSVGGSDLTGGPYANTVPGPWVGVAAPAMNIVSLDPTKPHEGSLVDGEMVHGAAVPLNGTSFSAAYITGLAALIRQKYPDLSAAQVVHRIRATAHAPAQTVENSLGSGVVDPIAALTATVPAGESLRSVAPSQQVRPQPPPQSPDRLGRDAALIALAACAGCFAVFALAALARGGLK